MSSKGDIVDWSKPIMVSMESFTSLTEANVVSSDGYTLRIPLMKFDVLSRNSNFYPRDDTIRSFNESTYVRENLKNRTWFGELEHPPADSPMSRFLYVEPTRYAWCILNYQNTGDGFTGDVTLVKPLGIDIVHDNIKRLGSNYAASCRIYTPNYKEISKGGRTVIVKKYKMSPITFDCVSMPGIEACRLVDPNVYKAGPINVSSESYYNQGANVIFDNPIQAISDAIKSSESGRILEDFYGVNLSKKNMVLTKDNRLRLSTESGDVISVPLNSAIINSIFR